MELKMFPGSLVDWANQTPELWFMRKEESSIDQEMTLDPPATSLDLASDQGLTLTDSHFFWLSV